MGEILGLFPIHHEFDQEWNRHDAIAAPLSYRPSN
jgi:hypothetical protein